MKKKLCIALAMIMTVGVVLSGCGETAGSDNKAEQGKQEGKKTSVVYGTPTAPAGTFNPIVSYMGSDGLVNDLVYTSLLDMKPDGSLTEYLAESYTVSDDQKTIEFVLRDGVKWHDG